MREDSNLPPVGRSLLRWKWERQGEALSKSDSGCGIPCLRGRPFQSLASPARRTACKPDHKPEEVRDRSIDPSPEKRAVGPLTAASPILASSSHLGGWS